MNVCVKGEINVLGDVILKKIGTHWHEGALAMNMTTTRMVRRKEDGLVRRMWTWESALGMSMAPLRTSERMENGLPRQMWTWEAVLGVSTAPLRTSERMENGLLRRMWTWEPVLGRTTTITRMGEAPNRTTERSCQPWRASNPLKNVRIRPGRQNRSESTNRPLHRQ